MTKGKLKEVVPYFDRANESFVNYQEVPKAGFSTNPDKYFLDRYEGESFEIESWLDIITAPYYIINKEKKAGDDYSKPLYDLFYQLFPKPADYQASVDKHTDAVGSFLYDLKNGNREKEYILTTVRELKNKITRITDLLIPLQDQYSDNKLLFACLRPLADFMGRLLDFEDEISLASPMEIKFRYYGSHRNISWEESPLSFFINFLYHDGVFKILEELNSDIERYDSFDTLDTYYYRVFRREYLISFRLINEKLKSILPAKRQDYIDSICRQTSILFNKSLRHSVKEHYKDFARPYQSLIRNLKNKYKGYIFHVEFPYDKEDELLPIEKPEFLKRLLALQVNDRYGEPVTLCNKEIKVRDIGYFIAGDMRAIPQMNFNWPVEAVYYLLIKLMTNKAPLFPAGIEASGKIHLSNGKMFNQKSFNKFRSELKKGKIGTRPEHELIDTLFR